MGGGYFPLAGAPAADEFAEGWQDDCDRCDWLVLRSGQSHAAAGAGDCAAICAVPTVGLCRAVVVPAWDKVDCAAGREQLCPVSGGHGVCVFCRVSDGVSHHGALQRAAECADDNGHQPLSELVLTLFVAFGMAFEVPVAVVLLVHTGALTVEKLKKSRPYAVVGAFIVAAIVTPPDVISQLMLAVPLVALYEAGLWAARVITRRL